MMESKSKLSHPDKFMRQRQKNEVKVGLKQDLQMGQIWQPLSMIWLRRWKDYVDYDNEDEDTRSDEVLEALYPGPIDHEHLKHTFGDEFSRTVVLNKDYVLLPTRMVDSLAACYGPPTLDKFTRSVINVGVLYSPIYQIELYPTRLEIYVCNKNRPNPTDIEKAIIKYSFRREEIEEFEKNTRNQLSIPYYSTTRIWVKTTPKEISFRESSSFVGTEENDATVSQVDDNINVDVDVDVDQTSSVTKRRRLLTTDITDVDGPWRLLRNTAGVKIPELLGDKECLEVIFEVCNIDRSPKESDWPRNNFLRKWRDKVCVGDVLDAKDNKGIWYESNVIDISENGDIKVHFRGWSCEFDEIIPFSDKEHRLQPLFSHTIDWRGRLEEGDKIEIKCSPPDAKAAWMLVSVLDIDAPKGRVQVKYSSKAKTDCLAKFSNVVVVSDDAKKAASAAAGIVIGATDDSMEIDTTTSAVVVDEVVVEEDVWIEEWFDMDSEDICALHTHTEKPKGVNTYKYANTRSDSYYDRNDWGEKSVSGKPRVKGAVGLRNLGNTCFMNSILQCLSNTTVLTDAFTSNRYKSQINTDNPLGHGGKLAQSYAKLMKDMWCDAYTTVVPRDFKRAIGEFKSEFAGYQQQDSQELLSFLLDGLHEDLNLIKRKPATTKIESKGRPDDLIARESWRRFLLRNDSEIVNHCFGQYRSHVACTTCGNDSLTFDEFSSITLPIPLKKTKTISVFAQLLPLGSVPVSVDIEVELFDTVGNFKEKLVEKLITCGLLSIDEEKPIDMDIEVGELKSPVSTIDDYVDVKYPGDDQEDGDDFLPAATPTTTIASSPLLAPSPDAEYSEEAYRTYISASFVRTRAFYKQCLHVGTSYSKAFTKTPIKHLDDHVPVSALTSSYDSVIVHQLAFPAPVKPNYVSAGKSLVSTFLTYADVAIGKMTDTYSYSVNSSKRIDAHGSLHRISYTSETSCSDMYDSIWEIFNKFVDGNSLSYTRAINSHEYPFDLIICPSYGYSTKATIPNVNEPMLSIGVDAIFVVWKDSAKDDIKWNDINVINTRTAISQDNFNITSAAETGPLTIYKCIEKFTERERMGELDTWYCPRCKEQRVITKQVDLWSVPDVLVVHLKRFEYVPGQYFVHREKIGDSIDFPVTGLDLTSHVKGPQDESAPPIYDLYGVSLHSGGLNGGHYTAICQNAEDGKWYNFNDSSVSEADPSDAVNGAAYLLFYKRRSGLLKWAGVVPLEQALPDDT